LKGLLPMSKRRTHSQNQVKVAMEAISARTALQESAQTTRCTTIQVRPLEEAGSWKEPVSFLAKGKKGFKARREARQRRRTVQQIGKSR